jgi:hypothetical protein
MEMTEGGVEGYESLHTPFYANSWNGLEYNTGTQSLLDGSVGIDWWWYAVGSTYDYGINQIPGPGVLVNKVELYVRG